MKTLSLTIVAILFITKVYAQSANVDSATVVNLRRFFSRNIRYPAIARENDLQGTVVVTFRIDSNQKISDIKIIKSLSPECDADVLRVFLAYRQPLPLSPAEYTAGITFLIEGENHKNKIVPFDKSLYRNFLFEGSIIMVREN